MAAIPGIVTIAEESTAFPGVTRRPTWVAWVSASSGTWAGCTTRWRTSTRTRSIGATTTTGSPSVGCTQEHRNFVLPLSHDEVVHSKGSLLGKMPGDEWQRFANLRCLLANQFTQPGKKLLFMGSELAAWTEWNHDAPLPWTWPMTPCGRRSAATWRTWAGSTATLRRCGPPIPSRAPSPGSMPPTSSRPVFSYIRRAGRVRGGGGAEPDAGAAP